MPDFKSFNTKNELANVGKSLETQLRTTLQ